ncbi:MAG: M23 family metallopeptidase [Acidobacteriota bacterium]
MSEKPVFEIRFQSTDPNRRGRVLRLSRGGKRAALAAIVAWGALVIGGIGLAPWVIADLRGYHQYAALAGDRAAIGARLRGLARELQALEQRADELRVKVRKVDLLYELGGAGDVELEAAGSAGPGDSSIYGDTVRSLEQMRRTIGGELRWLDQGIERAAAFEREHVDAVLQTPAACPLRGPDFVLTSGFGSRRSPFTREIEVHSGIDLAARLGAPVHAPAAGTVAFAGKAQVREDSVWWRFGNLVVLRHGDRYLTIYGHLDQIAVRSGQRLHAGEVLGTVGSSGWSASPHLHYEVRRRQADGTWVPVDARVFILDHHWKDSDEVLARAATGVPLQDFAPLPAFLGGR